jgi:prephenate dehydrogenase
MTRLALSPADLWTSILATNKANVTRALRSYAEILVDLERALEKEDLDAIFEIAGQFSSELRKADH